MTDLEARLRTACVELHLPAGDSAAIALQGAQVLSWRTADGRERLYLSPKAVLGGSMAIRGGIPVCWPQFNQRGPLAKHGFARLLDWRVVHQEQKQDVARAVLRLQDTDVPQRLTHSANWEPLWPHGWRIELHVALHPGRLEVALHVHNTGSTLMPFTVALHSYLAVDDVTALTIDGADGLTYWDAVPGAQPTHPQQQGAITFAGEVDRVYPALQPAALRDGPHALQASQTASMAQTVVWSPGAALSRTLVDLPRNDWQRFVCVEAAQIDTPVLLQPGEVWHGGQVLQVQEC